ncbi:2,3-bisphosphoglycerate-independent phosphoglycerate mutase [Candidatus Woesearchaeota archaeon]|nr:2,3-bisphosphoglycerate-independent phosphoglycerate mutase [Candidatus Woesearchaeota archaeon]
MKTILVVLDGMADRPSDKLGNKTPLEAAETPSMDKLARNGSLGQLDILEGIAPESDSAVLSILGYDPHRYYTGRGPLEAVGIGIRMRPGTLALRCNFATAAKYPELKDRRVARSLTSEESHAIAEAISNSITLKNAEFDFKASVAHRAVLMIRAKEKLSSRITNTDPAYAVTRKGIPEALAKFEMKLQESKPLDNTKEAAHAAELLNEFTRKSYELLDSHPINRKRREKGMLPANAIISRDGGDRMPDLYDISEKHGRKFAILADMPLEIGIGTLSGMGIVQLPFPTFTKEDHAIRVEKTVHALKNYDALYIHIKGPDLFGHEGDHEGKKQCIQDIDKHYFEPLLKRISLKETVIAITSDHSTPCSMKGHSGDPVPFVISGGNVPSDKVTTFSEQEAEKGSYGKIHATGFMPLVMKLSGK